MDGLITKDRTTARRKQTSKTQVADYMALLWGLGGGFPSSPPGAAGAEGSFNLEACISMLMTRWWYMIPRKERTLMLSKLHTLYLLHFKQEAENRGRML